MLQQSLRRCIRPSAVLFATSPCKACACQCGATFSSRNGSYGTQSRQYAYATTRKSPATLSRKRNIRTRDSVESSSVGYENLYRFLSRRHRQGLFSTDPDQVMEFISDFKALASRTTGGATIDPRQMRDIMDEHGLDDKDSWKIPHMLMANGDKDSRYIGRRMLLSMSRAGVEEATIRVMAHVVLESRKKPEKLYAREVQYAKQHLAEVASKKVNFRAMVCEGKVARALGNEDRAIEMWTDAMAAAVEDAEEQESKRLNMDKAGGRSEARVDPMELSTPWIELMLLHRERSELKGKDEMQQCRWAMEIGCKQDDPTSHYHASTFVKQYAKDGSHMPTSEWLYYVTKAAASSHPIAAYELAKFYAESGWKYLDDEPPDHVKPTPFDSFPAARKKSFTYKLSSFLGLATRPELKPEESLFHNAIFPYTAKDRYALAIEWLDVATMYTYAPAYLFRAQLHLQKTLWAQADAPQAAIEMSADRYTYASGGDFDLGKILEKSPIEESADPPNPFYNVKWAQTWLREVFFAHEAYHYGGQVKRAYTLARRRGAVAAFDDESDLLDERVFSETGLHIQKWFRFPEVREMYEDDIEGLYLASKRICDEHGWNIYDLDNGLIYKAGSGKKRAIKEVFITS